MNRRKFLKNLGATTVGGVVGASITLPAMSGGIKKENIAYGMDTMNDTTTGSLSPTVTTIFDEVKKHLPKYIVVSDEYSPGKHKSQSLQCKWKYDDSTSLEDKAKMIVENLNHLVYNHHTKAWLAKPTMFISNVEFMDARSEENFEPILLVKVKYTMGAT